MALRLGFLAFHFTNLERLWSDYESSGAQYQPARLLDKPIGGGHPAGAARGDRRHNQVAGLADDRADVVQGVVKADDWFTRPVGDDARVVAELLEHGAAVDRLVLEGGEDALQAGHGEGHENQVSELERV